MEILEILDNIVDKVADKGIITNITENNGIYTISTNVNYLQENQVIEISNTDNFNGKYVVSNITNNSFEIKTDAGLVIAGLGGWTCLAPYYDYGLWVDLQNRIITEYTNPDRTQRETTPLIFVVNNFDKGQSKLKSFFDVNLEVYVIQSKHNLHQFTEKKRNEYMPYLRMLGYKFINELEKVTYISNVVYNENFFTPFELSENTQMIKITFKIKYNKNLEIKCLT